MQIDQEPQHIELRVNRDFGGIITVYFDFLKQNIKKFTNVFLSYNGIFLIGILIVSYLMVTGFIGVVRSEQGGITGAGLDETYAMYIGAGAILFFFIFIIIAILNYSLAGAYMIKYDEKKGLDFDKTEVWQLVKQKLGKVTVYVLLLVGIYLVFMVVYFVIGLIPLIGLFANLFGQYLLAAWLGVSFLVLLDQNRGVTDSYGEGWSLVTKNFWMSIGVNFILGLLNAILLMLIVTIPGVLVGLYTYHVVESGVNLSESNVPTIIYTIFLSVFLMLMAYAQCLSQFINGILYYSLHEKTYNLNTRSKIDQIGNLE